MSAPPAHPPDPSVGANPSVTAPQEAASAPHTSSDAQDALPKQTQPEREINEYTDWSTLTDQEMCVGCERLLADASERRLTRMERRSMRLTQGIKDDAVVERVSRMSFVCTELAG